MVESLPQGDLKDNVTLMSALNKIMYAVKPTGFNLMAGEDSDPKKEPGGYGHVKQVKATEYYATCINSFWLGRFV